MAAPDSSGHAFISYVREDAASVNNIYAMLQAAGVPVWRDTENLWPGEDWRLKIRQAITADSLAFIICFSGTSEARTSSYQNEELLLAIDEYRKRPPDRPWIIPVRLDDCRLPAYDLGAGRTLDSLQRLDMFGERRDEAAARLIAAVLRIIGDTRPASAAKANQMCSTFKVGTEPLISGTPVRPVEVRSFVGRDAELAKLDDWAAQPGEI